MKSLIAAIVLSACPAVAGPLYPNSVASNDLDFIRMDDPTTCFSVVPTAPADAEMYDPRRDVLQVTGVLHFEVRSPDHILIIRLHPAVPNPAARAQAVAASVARLPDPMRLALRSVHILDGDGTSWAEDRGQFFTVYDDLIDRRLADHDLDETVFHEAAHVALDPVLSTDPDWRANQDADARFVTEYAAQFPDREDIAESALFAWTMLYHPGRLPPQVEQAVRDTMPNRLEYLGNVLDGFDPPAPCAPVS